MTPTRLSLSRRAWLVAAASASAGAASWPAQAQSVRRPWPPGRPTPRLALPALDDAQWDASALDGHPRLVNFWATWCGPCKEEMRSLEAAADRGAAAGLRVVAVNFREPQASIRRFVDETRLRLPVLRDADGAAARAFSVSVFPSTVAIGRDGRARFVVVGEHDWTAPDARGWIDAIVR